MTISNLCIDFIRLGISVIAPYSLHVKTIRTLLDGTDIACNTVHKMLGAENDIIIFATTRSNPSFHLYFASIKFETSAANLVSYPYQLTIRALPSKVLWFM